MMEGVTATLPTPRKPVRAPFGTRCRWVIDHGSGRSNIPGSTGETDSFDTATRGRFMVGTGKPPPIGTAAPTEGQIAGTGLANRPEAA